MYRTYKIKLDIKKKNYYKNKLCLINKTGQKNKYECKRKSEILISF